MKLRWIVPSLVVGALAVVAATGPQQQALPEEDISAIQALFSKCEKAFVSNDMESYLTILADQGVFFWPDQRSVIGIENMKKTMERSFSIYDWTETDFGVRIISGSGDIAVATGVYTDTYRLQEETELQSDIQAWGAILRKQGDSSWKWLSGYFTAVGESFPPLTENDVAAIQAMYADWERAVVSEDIDGAIAIYADQAVEIFGNQVSNVGKANIRVYWQQFMPNYDYTAQNVGLSEIEGFGNVAIACGKGTSSYHYQEATELTTRQNTWAAILRKQDDGSWKTLVWHWLWDE